jgi:excisionase family DNA binding protein
MLSIKSCAQLLDCSPQFFRNLIRERRIGYVKVEGMVRIPYSELRKIIKQMPSMEKMVEEALSSRELLIEK